MSPPSPHPRRIGYHASHEQFSPSALLRYARLAEEAGFGAIKCSDHFHPWSERQGQSGFALAWLGAAMHQAACPFGVISAPGYRYHPAILAQAIATLAEMFEGRLWFALGTGEAINEAITGLPWPEKSERNALLAECIEITRALLAGELVTHRGRVTVIEAKLYTRPSALPPLLGAAVTVETARWLAGRVDGLLTATITPGKLGQIVDAYREAGGKGPVIVQSAVSWAASEDEALAEARHQWAALSAGGEVNWDIRRPADFDRIAALAPDTALRRSIVISADPARFAGWLDSLFDAGAAEIYVHPVSRDQEGFIETFGHAVLPHFRSRGLRPAPGAPPAPSGSCASTPPAPRAS